MRSILLRAESQITLITGGYTSLSCMGLQTTLLLLIEAQSSEVNNSATFWTIAATLADRPCILSNLQAQK